MRTEQVDKIKRFANKKVILGLFALVLCAAVIGICSFTPFIIDPSQWQTTEFLTDELIICAIVIFSMISTLFIGQASNAQNPNSQLAKARAKFFLVVDKITDLSGFGQWVKKVLQPRDIRSITERKLRSLGIEDVSVYDLEICEIKSLIDTPQKIGDKYYKSLTEYQVNNILKLKEKGCNVQLVEPDYYLTVKNLIDSRTITERSSKEGVKKGLYLTRSILAKISITIISAMIFASLMKDLTQSVDAATAWMKFLSRLWAMVSSSFMGYIVGCQINDIDAEYIEMRITVQNMYLQDKEFKPMDQQELAKEEFKQRVLKEEHALLDNRSTQIEMKG